MESAKADCPARRPDRRRCSMLVVSIRSRRPSSTPAGRTVHEGSQMKIRLRSAGSVRRRSAAAVAVEEMEPRLVLDAAPTTPVLFIPGFAASTPRLGDFKSYVFNRGQSPTALRLSVTYEPLVKTLEQNGYVDGKTFFGATF